MTMSSTATISTTAKASATCPIIPQRQCSNTTVDASHCSSSQQAAIGTGVGVPLGLALLLALGMLFGERRRRKAVLKDSTKLEEALKSNRRNSLPTRLAHVAALATNHGNSELEEIHMNELDGFQRFEAGSRRK